MKIELDTEPFKGKGKVAIAVLLFDLEKDDVTYSMVAVKSRHPRDVKDWGEREVSARVVAAQEHGMLADGLAATLMDCAEHNAARKRKQDETIRDNN